MPMLMIRFDPGDWCLYAPSGVLRLEDVELVRIMEAQLSEGGDTYTVQVAGASPAAGLYERAPSSHLFGFGEFGAARRNALQQQLDELETLVDSYRTDVRLYAEG